MKKLEKNPVHLYVGAPCVICDTDEPVPAYIEGCDLAQDVIIAERTDWDPYMIKPILRNICDMTLEEAIEVANIAWFPVTGRKVENVDIKTTPLFPFAAIYFEWSPDRDMYEKAEDKEEYLKVYGDVKVDKFILSLDNNHNTIRLCQVDQDRFVVKDMVIYQSYKITTYLISKRFDLGLLEAGNYIIRNTK